jgi:hypothetical protein
MRRALLILFCAAASLAASAQAWTYYPYGGIDAEAFKVPNNFNNIVDSLTGKFDHPSVMVAARFDQVSAGVASWFGADGDVGKTIVLKTPGSNPLTAAQWGFYPRNCVEKTQAAEGIVATEKATTNYNMNPWAYEQINNNEFYYTVNFTEIGKYNFITRHRGVSGAVCEVKIMKKSDTSVVVATINYDNTGLNIGTGFVLPTVGQLSSNSSVMFLTLGKRPEGNTNAAASSLWHKVVEGFQISEAGEYVVRFIQIGGGNSTSFGGFTFFKEDVVTGAKANNLKADMFVSNNVLNISGNEGVSTVSVYDISGKQMMVKTVSSASVQLPLNLKNGLYVVTMEGVGGKLTKKVVVR